MADKVDTSMMPDKGANMSSDRARRINSLHKSVDDLVQEQNKRRLQVSSEISSLTKEQQRLMATLDAERGEFTSETASGYNQVVKSLGRTIQQLSIGVKNITLDTAKATSSAIGQYGKAIGEDISINKTNTMAMALARATPLFGYFAAKFMETDVFQSAAQKMKEKVSSTLSSAGESLANVFKKKQEEDDVPQLQKGGLVKKGGIVEVHAAEVVSPIDKILDRIDPMGSTQVVEKLSAIHKEMKSLAKVGQGSQDALLKSINELKVGMIGTASRMQLAWQRTLLEHPTFRGILAFSQTMKTVVSAPFRILFAARGGFLGDVRKATRTSNIYQQQVNLLALIYIKGMQYLRDIAKFTNVSAEALVGEKVSPTSSKTYTLFGQIKEFMTSRSIEPGGKEGLFNTFVDRLDLDRSALSEAGITSFSDLLSPMAILRNMGITKENIRGKVQERAGGGNTYFEDAEEKLANVKFDAEFKARAMKKRAERFGKRGKDKIQGLWEKISDNIEKMRSMKEDQEKREGPHSPSMAENISATAEFSEKKYKEDKKSDKEKVGIWQKIKEYGKKQSEGMEGLKAKFKKMGQGLKGWIPIILGFFSKIGGGIMKIVTPILNIAKWIGMFVLTKTGSMLTKAGGMLGGAATATKTAYAAGGVGGVAQMAGTTVMGAGGAVLGAGAGALIGGVMSIYDVIQAIRNPEGFAQGILTRSFAAFLGGTDSGGKGAAWGAAKGAGIGAAIGIVGGPIGVAIGGAIGAVAGGMLGFVGGKKLSFAIQNSLSGIAEMAGAIWKVVKWPFDFIEEGIKSVWIITKFLGAKLYEKVDAWLSDSSVLAPIWDAFKKAMNMIWDSIAGVGTAIGNAISSLFSGDWVERIKQGIMDFFFPIPNLIRGFKEIGQMLDEWLSGQDNIVGKAYRWAKKFAKDVSTGDLSKNLERALDSTKSPQSIDLLVASHSKTKPKEISPKNKKEIKSIADQAAKKVVQEQQMITDQLISGHKAMKDQGAAQVNAIKQSTNVITSNNTNVHTNNVAPGNRQSASKRQTSLAVPMLLQASH